jgi:para-nitrobenzyl esterase
MRGEHNHMPIVIGTTADEMTTLLHSIFKQKIETDEDMLATIHEYFGKNEQAITEHYPAKSFPTPRDAFIAAATDGGHTCPARRAARLFAAKQDEPVRRFFYTHVVDEGTGKQFRAGHSFDVVMLFRGGPFSWSRPTSKENELSDAMVGYWTRFARTGDPNGAGAVEWPEMTRKHDFALVLDEPIRATEDVREKECDFWDTLVVRE